MRSKAVSIIIILRDTTSIREEASGNLNFPENIKRYESPSLITISSI